MNIVCETEVIEEAGYHSALAGIALNKKQDKDMSGVALNLSSLDGGHNKFLEQMYVWVMVKAPRYWWAEADTFRLSSKSSESTMHTLVKEVRQSTEEGGFSELFEDEVSDSVISSIEECMKIEDPIERLVSIKQELPESFLQKRMWCLSYKTLRNIILQRRTHRLPHWQMFISSILEQVEHPELLPPLKKEFCCEQ